ncbi:lactonase family protein [Stakelama sp. CBK3Z-3]|uniref:Lactonase family protein n=1 Tax=Stakelama flava TaxID=2860338 RepID=A0ABS6XPJ6_9SPHN|nr:lactonase family protein [Stakelama flava]MBW4332139.1 lactonase family protein [Stakelama flava]
MTQQTVFIGTQATEAGQGIFAARHDTAAGTLAPIGWAAEVERPTWVTTDRGRSLLFATSEVGNAGDRDGAVVSFRYDAKSGALFGLGGRSSGGGGATHLDLVPDGRALFVCNFGGGQAGVFPVRSDGVLEPVRSLQRQEGSGPHRRQKSAHPHGVTLDPSGRFLLVPDMGTDKLYIYRFDAEGLALEPAQPAFVDTGPGSGPRLILFGNDGRFAYMLTELSAELYVYRWEDGAIQQVAVMSLDEAGAEHEPSAAAIAMSNDGRFLYLSNRGTHEIIVLALDAQTGLPEMVQRIAAGGERPWCAAISPDGDWLLVANQASDLVTAFRIDPATGMLTPTAASLSVPAPTGIAFA